VLHRRFAWGGRSRSRLRPCYRASWDDQLFAALVGANAYSDAYLAAFRIPNLLRDLFAEGALSAAFVPTFVHYRCHRGSEEAFRLGNLVVGIILVSAGALAFLGILCAGPLVAAIAPGFVDQRALTVLLTRIMMPFLLLVSLAAAAMGMLNAQSRFAAPALAPALFNVGSIAVGIALYRSGLEQKGAVIGWSLGTLFGGLLQLLAQLPSLRATGFRLRPRLHGALKEPGVRRIGELMGAAVIGLCATQVNNVVNTIFASHQRGAVSFLNYAFRLVQFPLGVFGVAIATVAGAGVAAKVAEGDMAAVRETMGSAMRLVAFLSVPSAVGLIVLGRSIVALIYEHGRFGEADTAATAQALLFYALGLYSSSAVKIFAPAFYALGMARVPVLGSCLGMAANLALNLFFYPSLGYRGVALGASLGATANFALLAIAWQRYCGGLGGASARGQLVRVLCASAMLALAAFATSRALASLLPWRGISRQLCLALVPLAAGATGYLAAARALGMAELKELGRILPRRAAA